MIKNKSWFQEKTAIVALKEPATTRRTYAPDEEQPLPLKGKRLPMYGRTRRRFISIHGIRDYEWTGSRTTAGFRRGFEVELMDLQQLGPSSHTRSTKIRATSTKDVTKLRSPLLTGR